MNVVFRSICCAVMLVGSSGCTARTPPSLAAPQARIGLEANKALIRRFYDELWNGTNPTAAHELASPDALRHEPGGGLGLPSGAAGLGQNAQRWRVLAPDLRLTVDMMIAEGDFVAARWTMRGTRRAEPAHARPARPFDFSGVNIFRIQNGRIAEVWNHRDDLIFQKQMSLAPPATQTPKN